MTKKLSLTDAQLLTQAKHYLSGKDFKLSNLTDTRNPTRVIAYINAQEYPDYITIENFKRMI